MICWLVGWLVGLMVLYIVFVHISTVVFFFLITYIYDKLTYNQQDNDFFFFFSSLAMHHHPLK
jgi:hypothetical protein